MAPGASASAALPASALSHPLPNQSLPASATATAALSMGSAQSASDSASASTASDAAAKAQLVDPKAQISSDSFVEGHTRVGERTTIKRSVVGRGCVIGKNVKLTSAIVMDGVRIGDK